ncbi:MAG: alpha/beta hydrolase [Boseongicola sp. SB0676_bin_33]|nr:alpha/beta hydrolase [Boseongicola sp. SB0676_bin_33]MYK31904.1 alpha/beta hydrolase [Boseongicola sp. SB0670_bin_30]
MSGIEISQRAREIERQFESMPRAAEFDLTQERLNTKDAHLLTGMPRGVSMEWETIAGTSCIRMRPKDVRTDREVVFLHGGAYCLMSAMTHHRFGGHFANAAEADVIIPDYALAPEAPFPLARDECLAVIQDRLATGSGHCILAGDSAGGGLALSVACALRDAGERSPSAIVLLSPWLDLSLSGTCLQSGDIDDPILSLRNLETFADLYRGDYDLTDPGASPLFAELHDLPPLLLQIAEKDLVREDAERLAARWTNPDTLTVETYKGMLHSFQMFAGDMPEADLAIARIPAFLARHL